LAFTYPSIFLSSFSIAYKIIKSGPHQNLRDQSCLENNPRNSS
jgi:hypothetical protein